MHTGFIGLYMEDKTQLDFVMILQRLWYFFVMI